jgi:hypothetical protein
MAERHWTSLMMAMRYNPTVLGVGHVIGHRKTLGRHFYNVLHPTAAQ